MTRTLNRFEQQEQASISDVLRALDDVVEALRVTQRAVSAMLTRKEEPRWRERASLFTDTKPVNLESPGAPLKGRHARYATLEPGDVVPIPGVSDRYRWSNRLQRPVVRLRDHEDRYRVLVPNNEASRPAMHAWTLSDHEGRRVYLHRMEIRARFDQVKETEKESGPAPRRGAPQITRAPVTAWHEARPVPGLPPLYRWSDTWDGILARPQTQSGKEFGSPVLIVVSKSDDPLEDSWRLAKIGKTVTRRWILDKLTRPAGDSGRVPAEAVSS